MESEVRGREGVREGFRSRNRSSKLSSSRSPRVTRYTSRTLVCSAVSAEDAREPEDTSESEEEGLEKEIFVPFESSPAAAPTFSAVSAGDGSANRA